MNLQPRESAASPAVSDTALAGRVAELENALAERSAELAVALEQQAATSEILRAISASPADTAPVFDAIVDNTLRLCEATFACLLLIERGLLVAAAHTTTSPEFSAYLEAGFAIDRSTTAGRAATSRRSQQIVDIHADPEFRVTAAHISEGVRTVLAVPMLDGEERIGVIITWRREVRAFAPRQIALLETFARQAVIALQNVRLFRRIEDTRHRLDLANQAKSRLLAAASHDLRQPMHAMALYVDQLRMTQREDERVELTRRIDTAVNNLAELLDQLLDLSRLESGSVQAELRDFSLHDLLATVAFQFEPVAAGHGLRLRVRAPDARVHSDAVLVQRIVLNLVANAIRYTETGGVLLASRRRGERMRVEVWDTGMGIPEDRRDDVFREFVRLDQQHHRRASGLGLGLAIVARLAELLGIRIELASRVGRGSVFAFELPLAVARAPGVDGAEVAASLDLRGVFALVIDDEPDLREAMCGLLGRWGCLTAAAADVESALRVLADHDRPPEVIVSDYQLGDGRNGLDLIAQLRIALDAPLPALLVTAETAAETLRAAQVAGVPLLHKPVSPVKLRALLTRMLAAAAPRKAA